MEQQWIWKDDCLNKRTRSKLFSIKVPIWEEDMVKKWIKRDRTAKIIRKASKSIVRKAKNADKLI